MEGFQQQFIISVFIILLGYFFKRTKILKESDGQTIARIVFNITLPALVIVTFNQMEMTLPLVSLIFIALLFGLAAALIGYFAFRSADHNIKGMAIMMVPGVNVGLFAFPLVEAIWGREGIQHFGMFDVGNAVIVFGLCYFIASYFAKGTSKFYWRETISPLLRSIPFLTYMFVVALNVLDLHLPELFIDTAEIISVANMPLSLLLLGLYLNFSFEKSWFPLLSKYLAVKYGTGLALGFTLFWLFSDYPMLANTVLIGFILPSSTTAVVYAIRYRYDAKMVGTLVNITIILSFILIWVLASFVAYH
ncbi:AEC family transporter [Oceanobacillus jeddahense]|uniref:AEC family transporter n=1 Tax=Oceanobacillus jeddahense TaxID=1462527 RepID=A0ABY5JNJ1_9BACI|nr:AEC family transporter [Oceanobacillus jeddahense]UUI01859.1 AEC family transporter [Oceanobacillus jeddahense]